MPWRIGVPLGLFLAVLAVPAVAGQWGTSYGNMTLPDHPANVAVYASYTDDGGRIIGHMSLAKGEASAIISGVWVENNSDQACDSLKDGSAHWGNVNLVFDESYTHFSGTWNYCGSGSGHSWNGQVGESRRSKGSK